MKKKSLYIIVFLLIVSGYFIYNSYNLIKDLKTTEKTLKETNEGYDNNIQYAIQLEDSISGFKNIIDSLQNGDRFSLPGNPKSNAYLNQTFNKEQNWDIYLKDKLLKTNDKQTGDNPIIPYAGMAGAMQIDDAKVLNHRWIIAHFTDGSYQGEMLVRYDIDKNGHINFRVLDQTLYK